MIVIETTQEPTRFCEMTFGFIKDTENYLRCGTSGWFPLRELVDWMDSLVEHRGSHALPGASFGTIKYNSASRQISYIFYPVDIATALARVGAIDQVPGAEMREGTPVWYWPRPFELATYAALLLVLEDLAS